MELTDKDRIFLINQYEIWRKLDPQYADYCEERIEILESGYQIFYPAIYERLSEPMSIEAGEFVHDILTVYRLIH